MELNVNGTVFIELGPKTLALLGGSPLPETSDKADEFLEAIEQTMAKSAEKVNGAPKRQRRTKAEIEADKVKTDEQTEAPTEETPKVEAPKVTAPSAEEAAKTEPKTGIAFADMNEDEKLEAIQDEVTKHMKRGRSADLKFMLSQFDAAKASALDTDSYDDFYAAILRYGNGEKVEDLFPSDLA